MRRLLILFWVGLTALLSSCSATGQTPATPQKWKVGFWFWEGSEVTAQTATLSADTVYFHGGRIEQGAGRNFWFVGRNLPEPLPDAKEYWMTLRYERQQVPSVDAIPQLGESLRWTKAEADRRHIPFAGVQLDIDAPTGSLRQYATFLREVRKVLPSGTRLSITALLDWFREGTSISEVIKEVDEFVPQFYDLSGSDEGRGTFRVSVSQPQDLRPVAARIDSAEWGPRFNRYAKPYRIGISTFGRSGIVSSGRLQIYGDLSPMTVASIPGFVLQKEQTPAGEVLLKYSATRPISISYAHFDKGDRVEFVLPTPEAVRAAYNSARRMGGYCAGVVFFRWPVPDHDIALEPTEVLPAIGTIQPDTAPRIVAKDGGCASVHCFDLQIFNVDGRSGVPAHYEISSSVRFEYFLPEKGVPTRLSGPDRIELTLPPYPGTSHIYLGRAVTADRPGFSVKKVSQP